MEEGVIGKNFEKPLPWVAGKHKNTEKGPRFPGHSETFISYQHAIRWKGPNRAAPGPAPAGWKEEVLVTEGNFRAGKTTAKAPAKPRRIFRKKSGRACFLMARRPMIGKGIYSIHQRKHHPGEKKSSMTRTAREKKIRNWRTKKRENFFRDILYTSSSPVS